MCPQACMLESFLLLWFPLPRYSSLCQSDKTKTLTFILRQDRMTKAEGIQILHQNITGMASTPDAVQILASSWNFLNWPSTVPITLRTSVFQARMDFQALLTGFYCYSNPEFWGIPHPTKTNVIRFLTAAAHSLVLRSALVTLLLLWVNTMAKSD